MKSCLSLIAAAAVLAACATAPEISDAPENAPEMTAGTETFSTLMQSVDNLENASNEHAAIEKLTLMLGRPDLDEDQFVQALRRRAALRYGAGNDVQGAIDDLEELSSDHAGHPGAGDAMRALEVARAEAEALRGQLESGDLDRMQRFETLFRLGEHQTAADLLMAGEFSPGDIYLTDLFQMGYLCDGETLAGPVYRFEEPDGTPHTAQFCALD